MTLDEDDEGAVFGANEQTDVDIDVVRYVRLARLVLEAERIALDAEMSLLFVDEATIAELNERFLGYPARPMSSRSRWTTNSRPAAANPTRVGGARFTVRPG